MSDKMVPIPFGKLLDHILDEYRKDKTVFGIRKFYAASPGRTLPLFGETVETPFGPAAGPHTQLAQNIVAAYVCGSRFFELKTVQKLDGDDLHVSKPCITAADEGYNCEWSTELTVPQAYDEYVKAWFCLKLLSKELELGGPDGFIFNMSVGYDLAGIKLPKIDKYIEEMKFASGTPIFETCRTIALEAVRSGKLHRVTVSDIEHIGPQISRSITISTLHGCPPDEIERMATYLLTEKNLHTFVKCNPTLLGYDYARKVLDSLGFDYVAFDDHHFKEDLQYEDAVPMFTRLQKKADTLHLSFGVKLTNTFPVDVEAGELPSGEMYMSGRSLAPLTLSVAKKLSGDFDGRLRISYSGGADFRNIDGIVKAGIWPVTMATTMLKPGGYQRLVQIAQKFDAYEYKPFAGIDVSAVAKLADDACRPETGDRKPLKNTERYKSVRPLPLFDCFSAPCRETCPIRQDIPAYIRFAGAGDYRKALEIITDKNPLPFITGTICPHSCMGRCTRNFYDASVAIRSVKLEAAERAYEPVLADIKERKSAAQRAAASSPEKRRGKVAVIGGGPAGISAAYLLAREGIAVTVFEEKESCGGIVRYVIPSFRIGEEAVTRDLELAKAAGAQFVTGKKITDIGSLFGKGYTDVLIATGAWEPARLELPGTRVFDAIEFLLDCRKENSPPVEIYGKSIVVIGGGNTAMDAARAAKRLPGVEQVTLVYRRTRRYMPADEEELALALGDGVVLREMCAPVSFSDGKLLCNVMKLGAVDASGRRSPVKTGRTTDIRCDSVVAATGENVDTAWFRLNGIAVNEKGRPVLSERMETSVPHVYAAGDAATGPATVVRAIAGAAAFASAVTELHNRNYENLNVDPDTTTAVRKKGILESDSETNGTEKEGVRCLECMTVCENCVDVCPNRANVAISVPDASGRAVIQILHIDGMCNECGNCAVFCPYEGKPYRDKFTLFSSVEALEDSTNPGFAPSGVSGISGTGFRVRIGAAVRNVDIMNPPADMDGGVLRLIRSVRERYPYLYS